MRSEVWTTILTVGVLVTLAEPVGAQAPTKTTMDSVYSAEQATKGATTWTGLCESCHTPHSGPAFFANWGGKLLSELFAYMRESMPKDNPGALQPNEYAQLLAYLMKVNGMPPGPNELAPDTAVLKTIRFDTVATKISKKP